MKWEFAFRLLNQNTKTFIIVDWQRVRSLIKFYALKSLNCSCWLKVVFVQGSSPLFGHSSHLIQVMMDLLMTIRMMFWLNSWITRRPEQLLNKYSKTNQLMKKGTLKQNLTHSQVVTTFLKSTLTCLIWWTWKVFGHTTTNKEQSMSFIEWLLLETSTVVSDSKMSVWSYIKRKTSSWLLLKSESRVSSRYSSIQPNTFSISVTTSVMWSTVAHQI